jgi:hypoxanthine-DNA glycosylase
MRLVSFPPVVSPGATVLILGSMPGNRSLRVGKYYGNPHNLFWPFMDAILGIPHTVPYPERLAGLQAAGIALWDVLKECEREGSLDTSIVPESERPNDFAWFLGEHPTIRHICLNGSKAAASFKRHVLPVLPAVLRAGVTLTPLPSTSPANRYISTEDKLARWRTALTQ